MNSISARLDCNYSGVISNTFFINFPRKIEYIIDIKRKKVKNEEDKVKEVTLSEWMRLAEPQSN